MSSTEPRPVEQAGRPDESTSAAIEPPPSRPPLKSIPWWLLTAIVLVALVSAWLGMRFGDRIVGSVQRTATSFVHAQTGHDHTSEPAGQDSAGATQYYTCGMHPWVILPQPGDCPICHMKLTPLDPAKFTGEVTIDPVVVQNIGVRVEPVTEGPLVRTIRTVGSVDYDETRVRDVNTKIAGWIEALHVDFLGASVQRGQPLFEVYSPELFQAQEEYLLALRTQGAEGAGQAFDLVASARMKLELLDVTPEQIEALAVAGEPMRSVPVLSPHTGTVIAKHANEGMRIEPGMQVFRIADLSRVWVLVTLYESQLPFVSEGQKAVMSLPYIPGQEFEGRVVYIYPYVDVRTREVQVRLEFDNPTGLLKPGMFATVLLQSTLKRQAVLVPQSAVLSTGTRSVAFVSLGQGRFEPRNVQLGVETGDGQVEVLEGLRPGELVVTSGQFLLDSESRVREGLAKMIRGNLASEQASEAARAAAGELDSLPAPVAAGLADALRAYFAIGDLLAADAVAGIAEPARTLAEALDRTIGVPIPSDEHFWHRHDEAAVVRGKAFELVSVSDLRQAREVFADLSVAFDKLIRATGVPPGLEIGAQSLHCPMFREGQGGAIWLQPAGAVRNPYFGAVMLQCFDQRQTLPVTGQKPADDAEPSSSAEPAQGAPAETEPAPEAQSALDAALRSYLEAQDRLTQDDAPGAADSLRRVGEDIIPLLSLDGSLGQEAARIRDAVRDFEPQLESLRAAFATVSDALLVIAAALPPSERESGLFHAYCPMVKQHWLQTGEQIRNPYDPGMLRCGTIKERLDREDRP